MPSGILACAIAVMAATTPAPSAGAAGVATVRLAPPPPAIPRGAMLPPVRKPVRDPQLAVREGRPMRNFGIGMLESGAVLVLASALVERERASLCTRGPLAPSSCARNLGENAAMLAVGALAMLVGAVLTPVGQRRVARARYSHKPRFVLVQSFAGSPLTAIASGR